jgi:CheY-like chemotaxis protein
MNDTRKTILHVDDSRLWREYVKHLLGGEYEVMSCADCRSALALIREEEIALVILDHLVPGSGPLSLGADMSRHLRKIWPELPVILYTGAWRGTNHAGREDLQTKTGVVVVFKDGRDPKLDHLSTRVNERLADLHAARKIVKATFPLDEYAPQDQGAWQAARERFQKLPG